MDKQLQFAQLTKARNQFRWALANLTVATICLVSATLQFFAGNLIAGLLIIFVSFLAVVNANHHQRCGARLRRDTSDNQSNIEN